MKRPKYKEMYEWEVAAHYATEQELQRFQKMYAELFEKYHEDMKMREKEE